MKSGRMRTIPTANSRVWARSEDIPATLATMEILSGSSCDK
jgi:hypothetical protein